MVLSISFLLVDQSLYVQYIVLLDKRILVRIGINCIPFHIILIQNTITLIKFLASLPGNYGFFMLISILSTSLVLQTFLLICLSSIFGFFF